VSFAPYHAGECDETATLVSFQDTASGSPIASIWHYACHPVSHTPSQVISADFPGAVRAVLRKHAGVESPVLFLQGFSGDIRPKIPPRPAQSLPQALLGSARELLTGSPPMAISVESWRAWVQQLTEQILRIAAQPAQIRAAGIDFASGCSRVPLRELFDGTSRLDSMLVRGLRLGQVLELVALGAEPTIGWQQRLTESIGRGPGVRVYAGYCGDVFGYLPLPEQVDEGGYEVCGFQRSFGMRGRFRAAALLPAIEAAVREILTALHAQRTDGPRDPSRSAR
jgi:hypothetical protein